MNLYGRELCLKAGAMQLKISSSGETCLHNQLYISIGVSARL